MIHLLKHDHEDDLSTTQVLIYYEQSHHLRHYLISANLESYTLARSEEFKHMSLSDIICLHACITEDVYVHPPAPSTLRWKGVVWI